MRLSEPLLSLAVSFEEISLLFFGIQLLNLDMYWVTRFSYVKQLAKQPPMLKTLMQ